MKTWTIQEGEGLQKLQIEDRPEPELKKGEVLVRWHATSLNYHDYLVAKGAIPVEAGRIPMSDGAGEVVAVSSEQSKWKVGDKVMSLFFPHWLDGPPSFDSIKGVSGETFDGYLSEYAAIHEDSLTRIPNNYTYAQAACLPCAAVTAWHALMELGNCQAGEKVLMEGTGGMSLMAMQIALAKGASVIATSSSAEKAERLKSLGVEAVFNYREDERWGKSIFKHTKGGVDHVLDVGGGSTMNQSVEAVRMGGKIYSIGILGNGRKGSLTFPKLFFKFIQINGIAVGSRAMQERMVDFFEQHKIQPIIDQSFAFNEIVDAFRYQESGKHFGKIVLEW